ARAIPALERVPVDERLLHRVELRAVGEPLDRRDLHARGLIGCQEARRDRPRSVPWSPYPRIGEHITRPASAAAAAVTRAREAEPSPNGSSRPADVGPVSARAGKGRRRFPVARAADVYCATMKPEFVPGLRVRTDGNPLVCPFVMRSTRASLMSASSATAIVARSSAIATGWP